MANNLIIRPIAMNDVADACEWYESQSERLGLRFVSEVEKSLESIRRFPDSYEPFFDRFRRAKIKTFPSVIYFTWVKSDITVFAVIHTSRDPNVWFDRL